MIDNWLYAPERMSWVTKPKTATKKCVFCGIVKGSHKDLVLHRTKDFMVIMNLYPYNTGHIQILPKEHVTSIEKLTDRQLAEMFILVKRCVKLLKKVLRPVGFNMGINQGGTVSGASIDHLHFHIVPRFRTDFGFFEMVSHSKALPERVQDTYRRLKKEISILE
ncbi:MAG: HIT domain-containing protein [Candidatus Aenigmarchaeota archaeon]|nr:HIT domain-containing protein [Candidatus Aenigmarchaeota archaeon]